MRFSIGQEGLRKACRTSIIRRCRFIVGDLPNRHVRQAKVTRKSALRLTAPDRLGACEASAWRKMSLRHVPLRGTGWSRSPSVLKDKPFGPWGEPYEFRIPSETGIKG